jgi:hypothetical protein
MKHAILLIAPLLLCGPATAEEPSLNATFSGKTLIEMCRATANFAVNRDAALKTSPEPDILQVRLDDVCIGYLSAVFDGLSYNEPASVKCIQSRPIDRLASRSALYLIAHPEEWKSSAYETAMTAIKHAMCSK